MTAAIVAGEVHVEMIVVEHVGARTEHRPVDLAGADEDLAQEGLFLRRAVPAMAHRNLAPVGGAEGEDVERVAEGVLRAARGARTVVHGPARIGAGLHLDHLRAEHAHRGRLHHLREEAVGGGDDRAGECLRGADGDAAAEEGVDAHGPVHAAGARTADRRGAQGHVGALPDFAPGETRTFRLIAPCRPLRALVAAAAGQSDADEREANERNASLPHGGDLAPIDLILR